MKGRCAASAKCPRPERGVGAAMRQIGTNAVTSRLAARELLRRCHRNSASGRRSVAGPRRTAHWTLPRCSVGADMPPAAAAVCPKTHDRHDPAALLRHTHEDTKQRRCSAIPSRIWCLRRKESRLLPGPVHRAQRIGTQGRPPPGPCAPDAPGPEDGTAPPPRRATPRRPRHHPAAPRLVATALPMRHHARSRPAADIFDHSNPGRAEERGPAAGPDVGTLEDTDTP
jgi:hypothetical protein